MTLHTPAHVMRGGMTPQQRRELIAWLERQAAWTGDDRYRQAAEALRCLR